MVAPSIVPILAKLTWGVKNKCRGTASLYRRATAEFAFSPDKSHRADLLR